MLNKVLMLPPHLYCRAVPNKFFVSRWQETEESSFCQIFPPQVRSSSVHLYFLQNFIQKRHLCSVHVSAAVYRTILSQSECSYVVAASASCSSQLCLLFTPAGNWKWPFTQQLSGAVENKSSVWTEHREPPKQSWGSKQTSLFLLRSPTKETLSSWLQDEPIERL